MAKFVDFEAIDEDLRSDNDVADNENDDGNTSDNFINDGNMFNESL